MAPFAAKLRRKCRLPWSYARDDSSSCGKANRPKTTLVDSVAARQEAGAGSQGAVLTTEQCAEHVLRLRENVERALRGKPEVIRRSIEALIAGGHLLLEDVPGVGKTTLAQALARSIDAKFRRIQFTSDILPGDVLGASVPQTRDGRPTGEFAFQPGPIFANVVLADEVNRASPKTQSALLEAMSEGSVSLEGVSHALPQPFFVVATQNPLEQHGTHPLPESQLDRFLMRLAIGYPAPLDEAAVLRDDPAASELPRLEPVVPLAELRAIQQVATTVKFDDSLVAYLLALVEETRQHEALELGVSPRGAVALRRAAQARALTEGRDYCIPDDVRDLAVDVFTHRVMTDAGGGPRRNSEETAWIVREILERVPVPI
jgi:MoxR-like ATPase